MKTNHYRVEGAFVYVDVSTRKFPTAVTKIDYADLPLVIDGMGRWFAVKPGRSRTLYAARHGKLCEYLHRKIAGVSAGVEVDHRDGDGLNNSRFNLRPATRVQNIANSRGKGGLSRFKGVTWDKSRGLWMAQIRANSRNYGLGRFADEEAAARAYDAAAREHHGAFAFTNFKEAA